ncbi:hypothetical protein [Pelobacter seleniigenes]|uniref:hypothetical protein n=1 Tax=Pelobacter seleniigenes TaxID=407188 RepID=UPI0012B8771C|nr:hypothetical protein [Pelobacter seleniigenes]
MTDKQDDIFVKKVCGALDHSIADLGDSVEGKLGRLKYHALQTDSAQGTYRLLWGGGSFLVVLLVLVVLNIPQQQPAPGGADLVTLQILSSDEPLDFYQRDIEFYEWLSEVMDHELDISAPRTDLHPGSHPDAGLSLLRQRKGDNLSTEQRADRVSGRIHG